MQLMNLMNLADLVDLIKMRGMLDCGECRHSSTVIALNSGMEIYGRKRVNQE